MVNQIFPDFIKKLIIALIIGIPIGMSISLAWAFDPSAGSSSAYAGDSGEEKAFLARVIQASQHNPIQAAASMYGDTTPMITVQEGDRTIAVLKQGYDPKWKLSEEEASDFNQTPLRFRAALESNGLYERNTYIADSFVQASASLKEAGFGKTLAPGYVVRNLPLTYQTSDGYEVRNFYGIVQPVVILNPHDPTIQTPLTTILNKMPHPHGALPALALWSCSHTTKWVDMKEEDEQEYGHLLEEAIRLPDLERLQDLTRVLEGYSINNKKKRISILPLITEDERNYGLSCFSQDTVEDDLIAFFMTLSGDNQWRNGVMHLSSDGTLLEVSSIDYERLYLYDSTLYITAPLAIRLRQGLYPFSTRAREKILEWDLERIAGSLEESRRTLILPILECLQSHIRHTPNRSLLDTYFHVFADMQTRDPNIRGSNIRESVGFSWARGYENTNSRHTPVEELVMHMKSSIALQDPAYRDQEPQWPDINFIRGNFDLGLHFEGSAIAYLRNPNAQEVKPQPSNMGYDSVLRKGEFDILRPIDFTKFLDKF